MSRRRRSLRACAARASFRWPADRPRAFARVFSPGSAFSQFGPHFLSWTVTYGTVHHHGLRTQARRSGLIAAGDAAGQRGQGVLMDSMEMLGTGMTPKSTPARRLQRPASDTKRDGIVRSAAE